jgi:hypothetical protein
MKFDRFAGVAIACLLTAGWPAPLRAAAQAPTTGAAAPAAPDAAPLFRVFLKDGTTLVSYGELARLDDRVVFSMPTSASVAAPQLQLITIPSDRVDWERTLNYAESVRATRYLATRAESDYALLTNDIAQALTDVALTEDPARRLAIVEKARRTLADWPATHYNYKRDEIQQMLGTLDEAIAELRAAAGASSFDLTFVAAPAAAPPMTETILPPPGSREAIEQTLKAAQLTTSPAERMSLLTVAAGALESDGAQLAPDFVEATRTDISSRIAHETEIDRKYQAFSGRILRLASSRAQAADVRGVQRVLARIQADDAELGAERPDVVASLVSAVESQLDAARRLRLERDRWALRAPELRAYRAAIAGSIARLNRMVPLLEDIKSLAGSGPDAIGAIIRGAAEISKVMMTVPPPTELAEVHNLLASAAQLADSAAKIRREAAINGNMARAWDASSAAAGALMLASRAQTDMQTILRPPQVIR